MHNGKEMGPICATKTRRGEKEAIAESEGETETHRKSAKIAHKLCASLIAFECNIQK